MKNLYQLKNSFSFKMTFFGLFLLLSSNQLFADGSRDLYPDPDPSGGLRAYLRSSTLVDAERWPFPNVGTHYVYANVGEVITMASSAQLVGSTAAIKLYSPNNILLFTNTTQGQILNRAQEKNGPQIINQSITGRYAPIYYEVPAGGAGIYRVELLARGIGDPSATFVANAEWTQDSTAGIMAWDISVINVAKTAFIKGRVYTNVLNLSNGITNGPTNGFHGIIYARTDDGFTYRINNNGNNGLYFTFFVNNNGFLGTNGFPLYSSLNKTSLVDSDVHNPRTADTATQVTHKMFYVLPDSTLPVTSTGAVPGNSTWLNKTPIIPNASGLSIIGVEGVNGKISSKGGFVKFTSDRAAKYTISIKTTSGNSTFVARSLSGFAVAGVNNILWDGRDANGVRLPPGTEPAEISVQLQGAEVHFPYIDMEYNRFGTIIQLLNKDNLANVSSSTVYWNDTGLPVATNGSNPNPINNSQVAPKNSVGVNSTTNGHIWGVNGTGTSGQFGDRKSIDTWAFVTGAKTTVQTTFVSQISDLKVSQLIADKTTIVPGDVLTLTTKVKNDGPSDADGAKFTFILPVGFTPNSISFNGKGCGTESVAVTYNAATRTYSSSLNLPNGCEIAYTIRLNVTNAVVGGNQNFRSNILRPNDVTDPDATDPNPNSSPNDAQTECANNGLGGICNNIRNITIAYNPVAVCTEQVLGEDFTATGGTPKTFNQPATNNGFVFDVYKLDNSFNMTINGTKIAIAEIEFQSDRTPSPGINIRFADGDLYEVNTPLIWNYSGSAATPLIRVVISPAGAISIYGSKVANGPLFPLELFNGNAFNTVTWNTASTNIVTITQNVVDATNITGRGYGQNIVPCVCYDLPNTASAGVATQHGITLLKRAGANNGNWPMSRLGAHTALESNTKGFVITRVSTTGLSSIATPVDGMMVYDTTAKCLKIYTVDTVVPSNTGWACFSKPACP